MHSALLNNTKCTGNADSDGIADGAVSVVHLSYSVRCLGNTQTVVGASTARVCVTGNQITILIALRTLNMTNMF